MAQYNTLQQSFNQMDDKKQVICIWNPNHVVNHSRYQKHQLHCPDRPKKVYKCQYNFLHEFRSLTEKDEHELNCEGMKRRLREEKEREELKKKRIGASVVVEQSRPGESSDPWADEGTEAGVKDFRAPGLGWTQDEIEEYIQKYDGEDPVCEYMLVAMSWSQKQRINEKQKIRTHDRAAQAERQAPTLPREESSSFRPPTTRNTALTAISQQGGRQGDESPVRQEPGDGESDQTRRKNPMTALQSQSTDRPILGEPLDEIEVEKIKFSGIGRGRRVKQ